ncbi:unnamed protein product [Didymodactylos carnosus]|uniref:Uncharacterized protein n=1 Tax=Didymodactylos carnosus TaxID=1234261 RepID=A0A815MSH7_9BILA|nr:unnamed protein product [Didymodactylos carnosus]CAF1425419.1 unnamed protein product [Didymodactylos carnosus]CAF4019645.1 unnamed protein product [Didymodactylos carnosus]CAF4306347.1 unnamed protein product [Didymodactylos carnosus]
MTKYNNEKSPISFQIKQIFIPFTPNATKQLDQIGSSSVVKLNDSTSPLLNGNSDYHHSLVFSDSDGGSDNQSMVSTTRDNDCVKRSSSQTRKRKSRKHHSPKPLLNSSTLDDLFRALTIECEQSLSKYSTTSSFNNKLYDEVVNPTLPTNTVSYDENYVRVANLSSVTSNKPLEIKTKVSPQRVLSISVSSSHTRPQCEFVAPPSRPQCEFVAPPSRPNSELSTVQPLKKSSLIQPTDALKKKDETLAISKTYPILSITNFVKMSNNTELPVSTSHQKPKTDPTAFSNILCTNSPSSEDDISTSTNNTNKARQRRIPRSRKQRRVVHSNENSLISNNGSLNTSSDSENEKSIPHHHQPPSRRSSSTNNYNSRLKSRSQLLPQSFSNRRLSIYDNNQLYHNTPVQRTPPLPRRKRDASLQLQYTTTSSRSPYAYNDTSLREHVCVPLSFLLTSHIEQSSSAHINNNKHDFVDKSRRSRRDHSSKKFENSLSTVSILDRMHKNCYGQHPEQSPHCSRKHQKSKFPLYVGN